MQFSKSTLAAIEQGLLVGLRGAPRGEVIPLGADGLLLDPTLTWRPRGNGEDEGLAALRRDEEGAVLECPGGEIRVSGQKAGPATRVVCNASIETGSDLYRVYYLPATWTEVKDKEAGVRMRPSREGLLQPSQRLSRGLLDLAGEALTPEIESFVDSRWAWPLGGFRDYVHEFVRSPLAIVRSQNQHLQGLPDPDQRRQLARELILFSARIESALFVRNEDKTRETYDELSNVLYLAQDDYLPGHRFVLGEESTYDREKLRIDKMTDVIPEGGGGPDLLDFLVEAKLSGADSTSDEFAASIAIFLKLAREAPPSEPVVKKERTTLVIQDFFAQGGVCRHQCAILQVALQEAGIPSRYLRGKLFLGGYHAWVEVDLLRDGTYLLILDPHRYQVLLKTGTLETTQGRVYLRDEGYPIAESFNRIWRGKLRDNGTDTDPGL